MNDYGLFAEDLTNINDFDLSKQNYEISDELKIRKILENNTSYEWVFDKNDDKYDYDIKAWKYNIYEDGKYNKIFKGFIEIEVATKWKEFNIPDYWYCVSFLYRKIYKFDWHRNEWGNIKDNIDKTFYLKFNTVYNNCFCLLIKDIIDVGKPSLRRNREEDKYHNSYCEVDKNNVIWGIDNCIEYINNKLS